MASWRRGRGGGLKIRTRRQDRREVERGKFGGAGEVPQEEWKGPPSGPRDTDPGHEATGETGSAEGPGRRCLELRARQKEPGPRASSPDLGRRLGPARRQGFPSSLGKWVGVTRSQVRGMAAGGSGRRCGGLLAFLALAPFPLHRVCSRVFELGDQGRGLSAALGVLRGLGGREARQALCGYLGPFIREPPQSPPRPAPGPGFPVLVTAGAVFRVAPFTLCLSVLGSLPQRHSSPPEVPSPTERWALSL